MRVQWEGPGVATPTVQEGLTASSNRCGCTTGADSLIRRLCCGCVLPRAPVGHLCLSVCTEGRPDHWSSVVNGNAAELQIIVGCLLCPNSGCVYWITSHVCVLFIAENISTSGGCVPIQRGVSSSYL